METKPGNDVSIPNESLFVQMVLKAWHTQNTRVNELLESLSDEQLLAETAPGRNRGVYLLGHLTAVNDALLPLLGFCERLYPQLDALFISYPDQSDLAIPSIEALKEYWHKVNAELTRHMQTMQPSEWFGRHQAVSEADFANEPHRNKLNILISRTNHQSYHLGQLIFLRKR